MSNSKGFSILRVLIVVVIIIGLGIGTIFYVRDSVERRERELEKFEERMREWEEKPAKERGDIIRKNLLILIEHKSKDIPELKKKLERINLADIAPQKKEAWIKDLYLKFFLMTKITTEREIRECCEKELERYLKILDILY